MSIFDTQWQEIAKRILKDGMKQDPAKVRARYVTDGAPAPTKYLLSERMVFDGDEMPILFSKKTFYKASLKELRWIMIQRSNKISDLHDVGVHIWDDWVYDNANCKNKFKCKCEECDCNHCKWHGTIGPAYGYAVGMKIRRYPLSKIRMDKLSRNYDTEIDNVTGEIYVMLDQVDYLIQEIINNPDSRRLIVTMWMPHLLDSMFLEPCVYETRWRVDAEGYLHVEVCARSQDFPVGTPFNVFQYRVWQMLIAQVTGTKLGKMTYQMTDVHIYDRHEDEVRAMLEEDCEDLKAYIELDPTIKNIRDFTPDSVKLIGYKDRHKAERVFEIAK